MATFTSALSGNWNDGATWGNISPGAKGTDWPGNTGDTFTISADHTVIYNVSETNTLGASTINGILQFVTNANTRLSFGNVSLNVSATGDLRIGTSDAVVNKAYTAELSFNTTSDNTYGIIVADGGKYSFYGDPSYYTTGETSLANDAENTNGDATIKTTADMSSLWNIGDEITLKITKQGTLTNNYDAIVLRTISSFGLGNTIILNSAVTIEADVGNTWESPVVNVTRNVKVYKSGASTAINNNNTNRPLFTDNTTTVPNPNVINNAMFTGFYGIITSNATITAITFRNGRTFLGIGSIRNNCIGNFYSNLNVLFGSVLNTVDGNFFANGTVTSSAHFNICYGKYYSNNVVFNGASTLIKGYVFSNGSAVTGQGNSCSGKLYLNYYCLVTTGDFECTGEIGWSAENISAPNTYDIVNICINTRLFNCKFPLAGLTYYNRNTYGHVQRIQCDHYNRVLDAFRLFDNKGDIIKTSCDGSGNAPSVDPLGSHLDCLEVSNLQTTLSVYEPIKCFNDYTYMIQAYASILKTYTINLQSIFTDPLTNVDIILEASYLSGTDGVRSIVASTGTILPRSSPQDWSQNLSVSVTPSQTGLVFLQLKLAKYEAGKAIYVWPRVSAI